VSEEKGDSHWESLAQYCHSRHRLPTVHSIHICNAVSEANTVGNRRCLPNPVDAVGDGWLHQSFLDLLVDGRVCFLVSRMFVSVVALAAADNGSPMCLIESFAVVHGSVRGNAVAWNRWHLRRDLNVLEIVNDEWQDHVFLNGYAIFEMICMSSLVVLNNETWIVLTRRIENSQRQ